MLPPRAGHTVILFLGFALLLSIFGCSEEQAASPKEPAENQTGFIEKLRGEGFRVVPEKPIKQEFFAPTGQILSVEGSEVQVFEFNSEEAARQSAANISPDGTSVGQTMITWVSTPHFYQKGKLIVLYVGTDPKILRSLQLILGRQIAGG